MLSGMFRPSYTEDTEVDIGKEIVIAYSEFPTKCTVSGIRYDWRVQSAQSEAPKMRQWSTHQLACYYLPAVGADATEVIGTKAAMLTYTRKFIPRYVNTLFHPNDAGSENESAWAPTQIEYQTESATDSGLAYELHNLPLSLLTNPNEMAPIQRWRQRMGWDYGQAYRPGGADKVTQIFAESGIIRKEITFGNWPGYIVWLLSNPAQPSDSEYNDESTQHVRDLEFENLRPLSPHTDIIDGQINIAPGTRLDALSWMQGYLHYNKPILGVYQHDQVKLDYRLDIQYYVSRHPSGRNLAAASNKSDFKDVEPT